MPPNGDRKIIIFKDAKGIGITLVPRKLVFKDMRSYKFIDFLIIFGLELLNTPGQSLKDFTVKVENANCAEKKTANCCHLHHPHLFWAPGLVFSSSSLSTLPTIMAWLQKNHHTPWKFNIVPENWPSQKERIILQQSFFWIELLNFASASMQKKSKESIATSLQRLHQ